MPGWRRAPGSYLRRAGFIQDRGVRDVFMRLVAWAVMCRPHVCVLLAFLWCSTGWISARNAIAADPARVAVVLTPHQTYRDAATVIRDELHKPGHSCRVFELPPTSGASGQDEAETEDAEPQAKSTDAGEREVDRSVEADAYAAALNEVKSFKPTVIVSAGVRATMTVLEAIPDIPVVFCMVPNALDSPFLGKDHRYRKRLAGVTLDVSPQQQLEWAIETAPNVRMIGLLHSPGGIQTAESVRAAAAAHTIKLILIPAEKDAFPEAVEALITQRCDGALMIADSGVYNAANAQRLLIWGLRRKNPVWGFSRSIVKAGAFAGLSSDPKAAAQQTAKLVQSIADGTDVATIGLQYPNVVHRAVNERTADVLGITLPTPLLNNVSFRYGKER